MSKDMVKRYNARMEAEEARRAARERRAVNGEVVADVVAPVATIKPKNDASVLKPDVLTLEGGVADYTLWVRRLRAWFTGAGYGNADVYNDLQRKEFFIRFLDSEVNARFDEVWESNDNKVANLPTSRKRYPRYLKTSGHCWNGDGNVSTSSGESRPGPHGTQN